MVFVAPRLATHVGIVDEGITSTQMREFPSSPPGTLLSSLQLLWWGYPGSCNQVYPRNEWNTPDVDVQYRGFGEEIIADAITYWSMPRSSAVSCIGTERGNR